MSEILQSWPSLCNTVWLPFCKDCAQRYILKGEIMLTIAQAEVIFDLCNKNYGNGLPFEALDAFPEKNNKANGCRRNLRALAQKGIIEIQQLPDNRDPAKLVDNFVIGKKAKDEFHKWATKRDYDFSCFDF